MIDDCANNVSLSETWLEFLVLNDANLQGNLGFLPQSTGSVLQITRSEPTTIHYTGTGPTTFLIDCMGIYLFVPRSTGTLYYYTGTGPFDTFAL